MVNGAEGPSPGGNENIVLASWWVRLRIAEVEVGVEVGIMDVACQSNVVALGVSLLCNALWVRV
jgi:hypothetical protein